MTRNDHREDEALLARALRLADALHELLADERRALLVAEPAALLALAERKRHLLETLSGLEPAVGAALARASPEEPTRGALIARLHECRAVNRENGLAAGAAMHHARSALGLLRGMLTLEDVTLYDGRGALLTRRERRGLGRA